MKFKHFLALAFLAIGFHSNAQDCVFFEKIENPSEVLNFNELDLFYRYKSLESYENIQLIHTENLPNCLANTDLIIQLPNIFENITFEVDLAEVLNANQYTFYGSKIVDETIFPNHLILHSNNGRLVGEISIHQDRYTIFPINNQYQVLLKNGGIPIGNANDVDGLQHTTNESACIMGTNSCSIDILVMFTADAATSFPDIGSLAVLGVEQLRAALVRSKIKHTPKLVGIEPLGESLWINQDAEDELKQFGGILSNSNSNAALQRHLYKPDLIVLLTSGANHTTADGMAQAIPATSEADNFAVVGVKFATTATYVFAHEVGHLLGGHHEDDPSDLPARAHEFVATYNSKSIHFLSMMHTDRDQILNFSNPNVTYLGEPTGTIDRFNACRMQEHGCPISNIQPNNGCSIKAVTDYNCTKQLATISIFFQTPSGSDCPVQFFEIEHSFDGINFQSSGLSSSNSSSVSVPSILCAKKVFFRITIFNQLIPVSQGFSLINIPQHCRCKQNKERSGVTFNQNSQAMEFNIFPNPAENELNLVFSSKNKEEGTLKIFDLNGTLIKESIIDIIIGENNYILDLTELTTGLHLINLETKGLSLKKHFIKI